MTPRRSAWLSPAAPVALNRWERSAQRKCRPSKNRRARALLAAAGAVCLLAAGCTSGLTSGSSSSGPPVKGGTATFALAVGQEFSWIFPIENQVNNEPWDLNVEEALYRPLYFAGNGTSPTIDNQLSLAYPPVWSDNNQTVTIHLKHYLWSDGQPVTSRDVEFFLNLVQAGKSQDAWYVPGELPDNIRSASYPSPTEVVLHLNQSYSQQWYDDNQLTWIFPLPQQEWDRTSLTGKVGDYDLTPAGAKQVWAFLYGQAEKVSTYATNPLWQTVDGPWRLTGYNEVTFETTLQPNPKYTGPVKARLGSVVIESEPDETAEVDALRSGILDYGYLPLDDYGLKGYLESHGFTVAPWAPQYSQWAELGYTSPTYGPLVGQLYVRQALQHLVDQPLYLSTLFHGYGQYTYGPVPNLPGSPYVSAEQKTDPDPYSVTAALHLLEAHGWALGANGYLACKHAGTGAADCGAGIAAGRVLSFKLMYSTGEPSLEAEVEAYQTAAKSAGVQVILDPQTETTMFSIGGICPPGPCDYGILIYADWMWNYGQGDVYPSADGIFQTGANYWAGGYSSPEADKLIVAATRSTGLSYLYAEENYLSRNIAALWFPTVDNQISVVKDTLHGWQPQQVFANEMPEYWYYTK
jgi:peptide/nickel transport system substrate-binding protein